MKIKDRVSVSSSFKAVTENIPNRLDPRKADFPNNLVSTTRQGENPLFESPMTFAYEKSVLKNAEAKFSLIEFNLAEASTHNIFILDKYHEKLRQLEQNKEDSGKFRDPIYNQSTIRTKELEDELQGLEVKINGWKKRMMMFSLILRVLCPIFIILMIIIFLFRHLKNNIAITSIILLALEVIDTVIIIILTLAILQLINLQEYNLLAAGKLNQCIYITSGIHLLMFVLGFVLIYCAEDIKGDDSMYQAGIIAFVLFGISKTIMLGYLIYIFKNYFLYYTQYCNKAS